MQVDIARKEQLPDFISFSDSLYSPAFRTEDKKELEQIITHSHPLSHYFIAIPIVVVKEERILARAVLTLYPKDPVAYLGYFESLDNLEVVRKLVAFAEVTAQMSGKTSLEGPLNASFWLGYRMKVNQFDRIPYFSELYQLPYYEKLWLQCGFKRTQTYFSNHYDPVDDHMNQTKYNKRYQTFLAQGYEIKSPTKHSIDGDFRDVITLLQDRFQTFPVFKAIEREEFEEVFGDLKKILHFDYVKLAYDKNHKLVGFLISIPDYGSLFKSKLTVSTLAKALYIKQTSRNYIISYMAVKEGHEGIGSALVYALMKAYRKREIKATSSYIQTGKVSGAYVFPSIDSQSEYGYFSKIISKSHFPTT